MYTIYYRERQSASENDSWHQINVTVDTRSRDLPSLKCNTEYIFKVSAWNELGESDTSNEWPIKTGDITGNSIGRTLSIAVPVGCGFLIIITVGVTCFRKRRMKRKRRGHKTRRLGTILSREICRISASIQNVIELVYFIAVIQPLNLGKCNLSELNTKIGSMSVCLFTDIISVKRIRRG